MANPRAGTIESLVKWGVSHGQSIGTIVDRVLAKFTSPNMSNVSGFITKYQQQFGAASLVNPPQTLTDKQRSQVAMGLEPAGYKNLIIDIGFTNPNTGAYQERSYGVTVPSNLRGNAMKDYAMNAMLAAVHDQYKERFATVAELAEFVVDANIREEE